ncbi:MAG: cation diffusion facilitator family transporter [Prolixibacteraceae bacterium]|nr:cation diffusion facilitator family transporter [Prolixibacteraceae bacterium]
MSELSAAVSNRTKIRLLTLTMVMEIYTLGVSAIGMMTSNSIVFIANFVIAFTGALASALSLYTVRKMTKGADLKNTYGLGRMETISSIVVGATMLFAAIFVGFETVEKILHPEEQHGGLVAMLLTFASFIASTWLWIQNYKLSKKEHSPIFSSIWRMARMGALEDLLIISAVGIALIFQGSEWTRYLDVVATSILMISIIKSIIDVFSRSIGELLDKSIDEYNQLIILRELATNFNDYDQIHGIRSRRSGSQTFIEIFLEFNNDSKMSHFYSLKDKMESELTKQIPGSQILIVPSKS